MYMISKKDYEGVDLRQDEEGPVQNKFMSEEELDAVMEKLDKPINFQKRMAAKMYQFIEKRMNQEMAQKGFLSNYTRLWIREYNDLVNNLQKNLYGDKSVSVNLHKISHAHIASFIREHEEIVPNKKGGKPMVLKIEEVEENEEDNR